MNKYRLRLDGSIKSQGEIRGLYPNTSLPKTWDQSILDYLEVDPIFESPKPTVGDLQQVVLVGTIKDSKGNWIENWQVQDKFSEYTNDENVVITKAEQEIAHLISLNTERVKQKKESIRQASEEAYIEPVTLPDGSIWNGGMNSALSIDGAVRMAENAGLTSIKLYDNSNNEHVVDIATGKNIAAAIGAAYQTKFALKQTLFKQLDSVDLGTATAKDEIEAVTYA